MYLDIYILFLLNYLTHLGTDEKETHGQLKHPHEKQRNLDVLYKAILTLWIQSPNNVSYDPFMNHSKTLV